MTPLFLVSSGFLAASGILLMVILRVTKCRSSSLIRLLWFLVLLQGILWFRFSFDITTETVAINDATEEIKTSDIPAVENFPVPYQHPVVLHDFRQPQHLDMNFVSISEPGENRTELPVPVVENIVRETSIPEVTQVSEVVTLTPSMPFLTSKRITGTFIGLWIGGVTLIIVRYLFSYIFILRRMKSFESVSGCYRYEWLKLLAEKKLCPRKIRLVLSPENGPTLVRRLFGGSVVVVPRVLWEESTPSVREGILRHEISHYIHGDSMKSLIVHLLKTLHWFNPMAHYAAKRFDEAAEWRCDAEAFGNNDHAVADLAETLLAFRDAKPLTLLVSRSFIGKDLKNRVERLHEFSTKVKEDSMYKKCLLVILSVALLCAATLRINPVTKIVAQEKSKTVTENEPQSDQRIFRLKITDYEGKPLPKTEFIYRGYPKPDHWPEPDDNRAITDDKGEYVLRWNKNHEFAQYDVEITAPGHAPHLGRWEFIPADPIPELYTVRLEPAKTIGGQILDDTGKPLAGATVKLNQMELKDRIGNEWYYETTFTSDENGYWKFESFPVAPINSNIQLIIAYPEYAANWDLIEIDEWLWNDNPKTFPMKKGEVLRGRILDESGKPIAGADVHGTWTQMYHYHDTTDEQGRFEIRYSPRDARSSVEKVKKIDLFVRADGLKTLKKTVEMDENGLHPDPVDVTMTPSELPLKIRIVDPQGKPLAGVRLSVLRWGDTYMMDGAFARNEILPNPVTDRDGLWVWKDAPDDELEFWRRPDVDTIASQWVLKASEDEHRVTLYPRVEVFGTITDAETGDPIPSYKIYNGLCRGVDSKPYWRVSRFGYGKDGVYTANDTSSCHHYVFKVEAIGYEPAISRDIDGKAGKEQLDFALKRLSKDDTRRVFTVLTPDGELAQNAYVSMTTLDKNRRTPQVHNGVPNREYWFRQEEKPFVFRTDPQGRFQLPDIDFAAIRKKHYEESETKYSIQGDPKPEDFHIFILHEKGSKYLTQRDVEKLPPGNTITLEKFARVEGVLKRGTLPYADQEISLHLSDDLVSTVYMLSISIHYRTKTKADGSFVFEQVIPGKGEAMINQFAHFGKTENGGRAGSECAMSEEIKLVPGETTTVQIGGVGRPVTGKLAPKKALAETLKANPDWNYAVVTCELVPKTPDPDYDTVLSTQPTSLFEGTEEEQKQKRVQWLQSEDGKAFTAEIQELEELDKKRNAELSEIYRKRRACDVAADGMFRLENVLPGTWRITAKLYEPPVPPNCGVNKVIARNEYEFTVPEIPGGVSDVALNLGTIEIRKYLEQWNDLVKVGDTAPEFDVRKLSPENDAGRIRSEDYRGKYIVIDFWSSDIRFDPHAKDRLGQTRKLYEMVQKNDRFEMFGVAVGRFGNCPSITNPSLEFVKSNGITWPQGIAQQYDGDIAKEYGVMPGHAIIVVGPDGKILMVKPEFSELEKLLTR